MGKHKKPKTPIQQTLWSKPRAVHFLLLAVGLAFGIALVTQVKASQSDPLATLSDNELIELMTELDDREVGLARQLRDLEEQLRLLDSQADSAAASAAANQRLLENAQIGAGTVPVHGPGVVIRSEETSGIIPSHVFVTTLAELRNAGAEAVELNGIRLTASSWFLRTDDGVLVDDTLIHSPFVWRAIGNPDTLAAGIDIRGGALSQMRVSGSTVNLERKDDVIIDSVAEVKPDRWAQTVD